MKERGAGGGGNRTLKKCGSLVIPGGAPHFVMLGRSRGTGEYIYIAMRIEYA